MHTKLVRWFIFGAAPLLAVGAAAGAGVFSATPTLFDVVRSATERFQDPDQATAEGYASTASCVSGPEEGAMGIHSVNGALVDGTLEADRPEALIYEAKNGRLRFVGVEYIVPAEVWHANPNHTAPPVLLGQHFLYVGSPNRYGSPAFYELHVWAWKHNPKGTFVDWNPRVSCDEFTVEDVAHSSH